MKGKQLGLMIGMGALLGLAQATPSSAQCLKFDGKSDSGLSLPTLRDSEKLLGPNTSFDGNTPYGDKGVAIEAESLTGLGNVAKIWGHTISVRGYQLQEPPCVKELVVINNVVVERCAGKAPYGDKGAAVSIESLQGKSGANYLDTDFHKFRQDVPIPNR